MNFKENFKNNAKVIAQRYGAKDINDFKDTKTAVNAFYNANAGYGKDTSKSVTRGKTKALSVVDSFLKYGDFISENKTLSLGVVLLLAGGEYFIKKSL